MRFVHLNMEELRQDPRFAQWTSGVRRRPLWVWKFAAIAAALVIIIPIVLLVGAAVLTFLICFAVLSVIHAVTNGLSRLFGGRGADLEPAAEDPVRRNVRVIRHEQQG